MIKEPPQLMLEGEPLDPNSLGSSRMQPRFTSSRSSTVHSHSHLADNFKQRYLSIRISSPQTEIKSNVIPAIPAILEAIEFYAVKALQGQEIILTEKLDSTDEKSLEQQNVDQELDYWMQELEATYRYLKACPKTQKNLVQEAGNCWEYLAQQLVSPSSPSNYPQFFQEAEPLKNNQLIKIKIHDQQTLWLSRQPQSCCHCIIL